MTLKSLDTAGVRVYSLRGHGAGHKLSEHLSLSEVACSDGSDIVLVHLDLVEAFSELRRRLGNKPIRVNSAYRTVEYNLAIGGSPRSFHQYGMALDLSAKHVTPEQIALEAEAMGFGGVGRYNTFTHVDVGPERRWNLR